MKIGILGTGVVGTTIGGKLVALGHQVTIGSRSASNDKAAAWANQAGSGAAHGTFKDAAVFGELLFNCTQGSSSLDALRTVGSEPLKGKILIDVANPLDFSKGFPPALLITSRDSLGEQIQREFPNTKVIKTLNTINCLVMVDPARIPGDHDLFISGNDASAKSTVSEFVKSAFGWKTIHDLGDITTARATEHYLLLWVRLYGALGTGDFNIKVARGT
jgi:predicted dinucleotide-binding enzyme